MAQCCLVAKTNTPKCVYLVLISKINLTSILFPLSASWQAVPHISRLLAYLRQVRPMPSEPLLQRSPEAFLTPLPTSSSRHSLKPCCDRKSESRRRKPKPQKPPIRIDVSSYLTPMSPPHGNRLPCCHGQSETATPDESGSSQSSSLIL